MDLRTAIFERGMKQKAVAKKAGVSEQLVSSYIRGRSGLSFDSAKAISKVLKCNAVQTAKGWDFQPKEAHGLSSSAEGVVARGGARGNAKLADLAVGPA